MPKLGFKSFREDGGSGNDSQHIEKKWHHAKEKYAKGEKRSQYHSEQYVPDKEEFEDACEFEGLLIHLLKPRPTPRDYKSKHYSPNRTPYQIADKSGDGKYHTVTGESPQQSLCKEAHADPSDNKFDRTTCEVENGNPLDGGFCLFIKSKSDLWCPGGGL